jgi:hypothetical protein
MPSSIQVELVDLHDWKSKKRYFDGLVVVHPSIMDEAEAPGKADPEHAHLCSPRDDRRFNDRNPVAEKRAVEALHRGR